MIYRERMTVEEMAGVLSRPRRKSKKSSGSYAFVFPYCRTDLSEEEEEKLESVVISLAHEIDKTK